MQLALYKAVDDPDQTAILSRDRREDLWIWQR